jgi:hypothetical protein
MDRAARLQRKLKTAAFLLIVGLAAEGISFHWAHPTSFMLFIIIGGVLVFAGIALYLIAIVTA